MEIRKKYQILQVANLFGMIILFITAVANVIDRWQMPLKTMYGMNMGIDIVSMAVLLIISTSAIFEHKFYGGDLYLWCMESCIYIALFADMQCWMVEGYVELAILNILANSIFMVMEPVLCWLYWRYIKLETGVKKHTWVSYFTDFAVVVSVVIEVINVFNGMIFCINEEGYYATGPLYLLVVVIPIACNIVCCVFLLAEEKDSKKKYALAMISIIPMLASLLQHAIDSLSVIYLGFTLAILIVYIMVQIDRNIKLEHKETELVEQTARIMVSQIQPHFIYNTLNAISYLCDKDPQSAKHATNQFALYLRRNLHSIDHKDLIEFTEELKHTEIYIWLEQLRFGERLTVTYNIQTTDFKIPPLTLQPLVENAIKHGLCEKEEGGLLFIETKEYDNCIEVIISDDGVGFDTDKMKLDGKNHVGLHNVENRLRIMSKGSLQVSSTIGIGTICKIILPKGENLHENTGD